jgi:hypothetical protein
LKFTVPIEKDSSNSIMKSEAILDWSAIKSFMLFLNSKEMKTLPNKKIICVIFWLWGAKLLYS